ncbi:hypothetical protein P8C59_007646 [Phyllachora maydis]|uniref:Uncharacterized protein n=1 Tax=Phyllachora maydis TaxID=1825666 RepID=A0AAD9IAM7_9PEZI|nr:hypothetical protein P8C59_007646 [Phyllachora maydis]
MTTAALPANHLWTPPADPADDAVALLETYSGIPRARVSAHVRALRDQALAVFPLPLHRPLPLPLPLPRPAAGPAARVPGAVDVVHASKLSPLFAWGDQVRLGCRLVHSFKPGLQDAMLLGQESGREAGDATGPSRDDVDDHERVKRFRVTPSCLAAQTTGHHRDNRFSFSKELKVRLYLRDHLGRLRNLNPRQQPHHGHLRPRPVSAVSPFAVDDSAAAPMPALGGDAVKPRARDDRPWIERVPEGWVVGGVVFLGITFVILVVLGATGNLNPHRGGGGDGAAPTGLSSSPSVISPSTGGASTPSPSALTTITTPISASSVPTGSVVPAQPHATVCPSATTFHSNITYLTITSPPPPASGPAWTTSYPAAADSAAACCAACFAQPGCDAWAFDAANAFTPCTTIALAVAAVAAAADPMCPGAYVQRVMGVGGGAAVAGLGPCVVGGWA